MFKCLKIFNGVFCTFKRRGLQYCPLCSLSCVPSNPGQVVSFPLGNSLKSLLLITYFPRLRLLLLLLLQADTTQTLDLDCKTPPLQHRLSLLIVIAEPFALLPLFLFEVGWNIDLCCLSYSPIGRGGMRAGMP